MGNLINYKFYSQNKFPLTVKIKARDKFISRFIDKWRSKAQYLLPSPSKIELNNKKTEPDIMIYLKSIYKRCTDFKIRDRKDIYREGIKKYISSDNKTGSINFTLYTKAGSFIKTNMDIKRGFGGIVRRDPFTLALLHSWINLCFLYHYRVKLHAGGVVDNNGAAIIFIGKSGSGKSTICNLLNRSIDFKIIHGDLINISSLFGKISIPVPKHHFPNIPAIEPSCLFFINKDVDLKSKATPIGKKEALKRVIFATEFPINENIKMSENRLDVLNRLVNKCRCFLLVNGKELKENPEFFSRLLFSVTKNYRVPPQSEYSRYGY